jgi:hypothetical protein
VPRPEKPENGESNREQLRRFFARRYAGELIDRALEANEYHSRTMPWSPEEHPAVMAELRKIRDTLYVAPQVFR